MRSPIRQAALAAGVAVLLVTTGCLGGTNLTETTTPSTSEPTPCTYDTSKPTAAATSTWSPSVSVDQYPPGVADNGTLSNASALVDSHFDATANQSMALRYESSGDDRVRTLVHGPDRTPFYSTYTETQDGERTTTEFYGTVSLDFGRAVLPNETLHFVSQNTTTHVSAWTAYDEPLFGPQAYVNGLLSGGNYSVNGTVERGDRTFVELTTGEDSLEGGHYTNGTVLVTADGVVYEIDATAVHSTGKDTERRLDVSMTLDTDVEWCGPPSWVGDVPHLSLSIVEDGHAVEIRNTGGATLPANTSFSVYARDEPVYALEDSPVPVRSEQNGTVTTDVRLEPGDAVYVTAGADGTPSSFALHDDPTRGEYTFGAAGVTGGNETVYYRLLTGVEPPEWAE